MHIPEGDNIRLTGKIAELSLEIKKVAEIEANLSLEIASRDQKIVALETKVTELQKQ